MYYEDRLGGRGFTRAILAGAGRASVASAPELAGLDIDGVRRQLQTRLGTTVETIDPRPAIALADRIAVSPALLDTPAPVDGGGRGRRGRAHSRGPAAEGCNRTTERRPGAARRHRRRGTRGERADRSARVLVDRAVQPLRGDVTRGRPNRGRAAVGRP